MSPRIEEHHDSSDKISWQAWSEDQFDMAKSQNRYILLDVEAVWCHWCHVMEKETYSNPEVVSLIQDHFIAVRVDQDARPDISNRFEDYGWPATVIFDQKGNDLVKLRGFVEPEEMIRWLTLAVAGGIEPGSMEEDLPVVSASDKSGLLTKDLVQELKRRHLDAYDEMHGGWGGSHRFVDQDCLDYSFSTVSQDDWSKGRIEKTLQGLTKIVDPIWGGIYQYSTHGDWDHPHFEKIMWMQTQAIHVFALAYQFYAQPQYLEMAKKVYEYLNQFLLSPEGVFYTSQDADLVPGEHAEDFFRLGDRARRKKGVPRIDTHVYARENGWAIEALAHLYGATGEKKILDQALEAAHAIEQTHRIPLGGFRHDDRDHGSFLGDSLAMGSAFLALYVYTADRSWLQKSMETMDYIQNHFLHSHQRIGGYVTSLTTIAGKKAAPDREENVHLARYANRLFHYTGNKAFKDISLQAMKYLSIPEVAKEYFTAGVLLAHEELSSDPTHITVVGSKSDSQAQSLFSYALKLPLVYSRIEWKDPVEGPLPHDDVDYPALEKPAAFFCTQKTCSSPLFTVEQIQKRMEKSE
ncbi:MAG: DUF255 domain-containing protein [Bdellovibrionota bacterium]